MSRLYKKRIGFLISDQHLIPHGGIGQFAKGFVEMCGRLNWKVDIILDKEPSNHLFHDLVKKLGANIVYPEVPLKYTDHVATFSFSDTINFEKIINFRKSLLRAFESNIYDMLVCNTQESMTAAYAMTVNKYIPVVFYTHLHSMIFRESQGSDVFLDSYHNFYNKHMEFSDIIIGTQSQKNIDELSRFGATNCKLLPMPMSERKLLTSGTSPKKGVLFIGRWEEGKNPEAYIRVMKECGLPARVMTNANGAKKFERAFVNADITDYTIKSGIVGQEKIDFIKGSSVFFMPSLRENYPFAFLECLGHCQTVVLDNQDWSDNFDDRNFHKININDAARLIKNLHGQPQFVGALEYIINLDDQVADKWVAFLNEFKGKRSKSNVAKINLYDTVKYSDYIKELKRKHLAREDFESVLSNRHKFETILFTDTDTYLSKDPTFSPKEEVSGLNLFEEV